MGKTTIKVRAKKCDKCKYVWIPKIKRKPRLCPNCKTVKWDDKR